MTNLPSTENMERLSRQELQALFRRRLAELRADPLEGAEQLDLPCKTR